MEQDDAGKQLLESLNIKGFENAADADWDDIRALQLKQLSKD
jgi:phosphonate transport system substrate-binding protein